MVLHRSRLCVPVHMGMCKPQRPEDSFLELILSFHFFVGPRVHLRLPDLHRKHLPPPRMSFKKNNSSWRCSNRHHRIQDFFVCSLYFGRLTSKMELSSGRFFLNSTPSRYSHAMRWVETKVHSLNKCIQKWLRIWFMALCYFNTRYVLCSRYLPFPLLQVFSASSFSSDGFAFWFTDKNLKTTWGKRSLPFCIP